MEWALIWQSLPQYNQAIGVTLALLGLACGFGLLLAVPLAVLRGQPQAALRQPVWLFTYVLRGTPLLVQLFLLYYGLAQFEAVRNSPLWPWLKSPWFCAVTAMALNTAAYTTEILHGAMRAVPRGEVEAGLALGLSRAQLWRRIILPSAFRRALPAYGNEVVLMLHATSLASVVTLLDLTGVAREFNATHYLPFEAFLTVAVYYAAITAVLVQGFRWAERRWLMPMLATPP